MGEHRHEHRWEIVRHRTGTFRNPRAATGKPWWDVLRWRLAAKAAPWPRWVDVPGADLTPPPSGAWAATMVNHSTVLLRTDGATFLTDPVFSERCSPLPFAGPRRVHPPALPPEELPPLDAVLLSHDHYDHCDLPSLRRIARDPRAATVLVAPVGHRDIARRAGFARDRFIELSWWQTTRLAGTVVTLVPAQHWSNRLTGRRNARLWGGFHLVAPSGARLYYAGDTGYDPQLGAAIQGRLGRPDLALLPVGAYEPRWFMREQHMNPEDAVRLHLDVGSALSGGIHWGTFQLTDESREAPVVELARALDAARVERDRFRALHPGERLACG